MSDPHEHYWPKRNPGYSTICYDCGVHLQIEEQVAYVHPHEVKLDMDARGVHFCGWCGRRVQEADGKWTRYPPDGNNPAMLIHALVDEAGGKVTIPASRFTLVEGALTIYRDPATDSWVIQTEKAER
jgi:hypothetical protein